MESNDSHQTDQTLPLPLFPHEVLNLIASHLDQHSVTQFALTCRAFVSPAERPIWRTISTSVNLNYGRYPKIWHNLVKTSPASYELSVAQNGYGDGVRAKMGEIMAQSDRRGTRRIDMVEILTIESRPDLCPEMITLLRICAPTILRLSILAHQLKDYSSLDRMCERFIFSLNMSFPSLTHLRIGDEALHLTDNIAVLTNAAPNLVSLDVDLRNACIRRSDDQRDLDDERLNLHILPKLQYLRFTARHINGNSVTLEPIIGLVSSSPELRQASVEFPRHGESDIYLRLWTAFSTRPKLRDLRMAIESFDSITSGSGGASLDPHRPSGDIFPSLKRLVFSIPYSLNNPLISLHAQSILLPALEVLQLDYLPQLRSESPLPLPSSPEPFHTQSMTLDLAASLKTYQHLQTIHLTVNSELFRKVDLSDIFELDDCASSNNPSASIRSFKPKVNKEDEELLVVRVSNRYLKVDEVARSTRSFYPSLQSVIVYPDLDGIAHKTVYGINCEYLSCVLTKYRGIDVPLSVIWEMEVAEGINMAERDGRGIEVGQKSWRILKRWYDSQPEEEIEEELWFRCSQ